MEISSSTSETKLATAKIVLSTAASVAAAAMLARSIAQDVVPHEFQAYLYYRIRNFFGRFSSQLTMVVDEFDGYTYNEVYGGSRDLFGQQSLSNNTETQNVKFKWVLVCAHVDSKNYHNSFDHTSTLRSEVRSFEVSFPKEHKDMVLESYFPYIVKVAKSMVQEKKTLKIFTDRMAEESASQRHGYPPQKQAYRQNRIYDST
ncbi:hypothetical protein OIU84_030115 [Salix udensis]|uniref:AAA-type ATPase N-terminal domain-containing protein n=1 Tax=Salix udensis TaxID=889485 RepID=A0AAD6KAU4_9ROSI|nr:hypothetical protein OIU84_030115 [Salix udensis]